MLGSSHKTGSVLRSVYHVGFQIENSWFNLGENGHFKNCLGYHLVQTLIFGAVMVWTMRFSTHPLRI